MSPAGYYIREILSEMRHVFGVRSAVAERCDTPRTLGTFILLAVSDAAQEALPPPCNKTVAGDACYTEHDGAIVVWPAICAAAVDLPPLQLQDVRSRSRLVRLCRGLRQRLVAASGICWASATFCAASRRGAPSGLLTREDRPTLHRRRCSCGSSCRRTCSTGWRTFARTSSLPALNVLCERCRTSRKRRRRRHAHGCWMQCARAVCEHHGRLPRSLDRRRGHGSRLGAPFLDVHLRRGVARRRRRPPARRLATCSRGHLPLRGAACAADRADGRVQWWEAMRPHPHLHIVYALVCVYTADRRRSLRLHARRADILRHGVSGRPDR